VDETTGRPDSTGTERVLEMWGEGVMEILSYTCLDKNTKYSLDMSDQEEVLCIAGSLMKIQIVVMAN